ncbi:MAG: amino acid permease [Deltaproteobacteria bacterium]|nr:amino acid permease [Deltaproteobacteria bacterium]
MSQEDFLEASPKRELSLFDSICIIVGIIIGAGIYETAPTVAGCLGSESGLLAIWLAGGLLALTGALCYAELATAYPRQGGDYVYLTRAYGRWAGYMFGWSQLAVVRPGDIALMAFIFARYAQTLHAPLDNSGLFYAAAAIALLTGINILGVKAGKWTQNLLTVTKILGMLAIIIVGWSAPAPAAAPDRPEAFTWGSLQLALILVLFTFGGWNEMAYVAAEIKRPQQNIVRALVIGTLAVTGLYLLINGAFLSALGLAGMSRSQAVAVDTVGKVFPEAAARAIAVLICISALGAVNGLIFTGARISYALGADHRSFRPLGTWHPRLGTPVSALLVQGGLSLAIVMAAGSFIDTILYTAPVVWLFFLGTGLSVFVLRRKEPHFTRPYKVAAYPLTPLVFAASCTFMFYSSVSYALANTPLGLLLLAGVLLVGMLVYRGTAS